jgi:leucyl-tRNA synthetase/predicted alpha/beta hydrolase family esterase
MKFMNKYDPKQIEPKWQKYWEDNKTFEVSEDDPPAGGKEKFYGLVEFPYPSGAGLHVGHPRPFTAMDVICRKKRMQGKNVLFPMGFDAFGLPTENFAIKTGRPPKEVTAENIANFTRQLKMLGYSFDWSRSVDTTDPKYFKWTQWIFLQLHKHGLAYKKNMPINWCLDCKIGLANEEVVDGKCERCGGEVEKRDKEQWMLAITKYADKLLEGLEEVDYINRAKVQQQNWIGRSEGALVKFKIKDSEEKLEVFTTRPDTLFGATYMVVCPEHELVKNLESSIKNYDEVSEYIKKAKLKSDLERTELQKEKTGVELKGLKAINPVNNEEIPIFVADYVLGGYGTGAIMAVPAHDERDYEFAKKYNLEIKEVVIKRIGKPKSDVVKRCGSAGVIIKDNKVLILYDRIYKEYRLPAGGCEGNETSKETLFREIIEESGYKNFVIKDYLGQLQQNFYALHKNVERFNFQKGYLVELLNEEKQELSEEDADKFSSQWMDYEEAVQKMESNPVDYGEYNFVIRAFNKNEICFNEEGLNIDSDFLNGLKTQEAKSKMIEWLEEKGSGKKEVNYKLRDWVFSRQRYWGEPIPLVKCESCANKKYNYIFVHGFRASGSGNFRATIVPKLKSQGHKVYSPDLPNAFEPNVMEQADYILENGEFNEDTIIVAHSLGGPVAFRVLEKLKTKIAKVVLVDTVLRPDFNDEKRPLVEKSDSFDFDWEKIKQNADEFVALADSNYEIIKKEHFQEVKNSLNAVVVEAKPNGKRHFTSESEPEVDNLLQNTAWIPIPEDQLPLELPEVKKYEPTDTGESPLAAMEDWVKTTCPKCGGEAKRETDTMPNWAGSSWYFLRYCDVNNNNALASQENLNYWGPIDWYNGGMEHTVLHLLYSRFWNQFLYDIGAVPFKEPYKKRTSHGMILAEDGEKMSKSRGNVINPDEMVEKFGTDAVRTYIMFMGPFDQAVAWDTNGLVGVKRFLDKVWGLQEKISEGTKVESLFHQTIKKVTEDIDKMHFNTAIAKMMELVNEFNKEGLSKDQYLILLKLLSSFAPHICEELWQQLGNKDNIAFESWPEYDKTKIIEDKIKLAVQINGKVRDELEVDSDISEDDAKFKALESGKVQKWLDGKEPKKVIYVKGKLVSIVI